MSDLEKVYLERCYVLVYVTVCVVLYRILFRTSLPGNYPEVLFWLVVLLGVPLDQFRKKVATLLRVLSE